MRQFLTHKSQPLAHFAHGFTSLFRGNVLKIHSVKKEDRGTYYCVADNKIGKPARRNVAVEVEFPPDVSRTGATTVSQALGYSVLLSCHVEAYPPPTITWVHDGIQLSTNKLYIVDTGYAVSENLPRWVSFMPRIKGLLGGRLIFMCVSDKKLSKHLSHSHIDTLYD